MSSWGRDHCGESGSAYDFDMHRRSPGIPSRRYVIRSRREDPVMDSFWDYIWYTIVVFAFVAYLIVLFHIVVDLFRDHTVSGLAKGVWVVMLVLLPYITAFVYLVARGKGMALRSQEAQIEAKEATDDYIRRVAGAKSPAEQIAEARTLLNSGSITASDFEQLQSHILGRSTPSADGVPLVSK